MLKPRTPPTQSASLDHTLFPVPDILVAKQEVRLSGLYSYVHCCPGLWHDIDIDTILEHYDLYPDDYFVDFILQVSLKYGSYKEK